MSGVVMVVLAGCADPTVSERPESPTQSAAEPDESQVDAPSIPTVDPTSLASIVAGFEDVMGLPFESAEVPSDLEAVGVQQKLVAENDAARIVLLVLAEPRSLPEDEETLLAGTEVGGTTETATYANRGRLFLAWRVDGEFPPLTQTDDDFLSPVDRILEQVPLGGEFGE